jgi:hypothetical protein
MSTEASNFTLVISFIKAEASAKVYTLFGSTFARASFCFLVNRAIL